MEFYDQHVEVHLVNGVECVYTNAVDACFGVIGDKRRSNRVVPIADLVDRFKNMYDCHMITRAQFRNGKRVVDEYLEPEPIYSSDDDDDDEEKVEKERPDTHAIQNLCQIYATVGEDDPALTGHIRDTFSAYARRVAPLYRDDAPYLRVSRRVRYLYPREPLPDGPEMQRIGKRAAELYVAVYGREPPKVYQQVGEYARLVNAYTEDTAPMTLDLAIKEFFR